jgi:hypothetical protein
MVDEVRWACSMRERLENMYKLLIKKLAGKRLLAKPRCR